MTCAICYRSDCGSFRAATYQELREAYDLGRTEGASAAREARAFALPADTPCAPKGWCAKRDMGYNDGFIATCAYIGRVDLNDGEPICTSCHSRVTASSLRGGVCAECREMGS